MNKALRIVLVENTVSDVELIRAELRLRGCEAQLRVVTGEADFRAALCEAPDLVLSDYRLPGFGGMRALELLRERDATIPFILISGTVGEEVIVKAMQSGATDYLLKDRLTRLVPAIERAMAARLMHEERARTVEELARSQAALELAQERAKIGSWELDLTSGHLRWSKQMFALMGYDSDRRPPKLDDFLACIHPEDRHRTLVAYMSMGGVKLQEALSAMEPARRERVVAGLAEPQVSGAQRHLYLRTDPARGPLRHLLATFHVLLDATDQPSVGSGTLMDVTERKLDENRMRQLNRTLEVMGRINSLIIRVRSDEDLFRGACEIAVAQGGFAFAWIGMYSAAQGGVIPVASAGPHEQFLSDVKFACSPSLIDAPGLIGLSFQKRAPAMANDIESEPRVHGKAAALQEGFGSLIVLPLLGSGEQPRGAMCLYSTQKQVFDAEEYRLWQELGSDVSFALDHLEKAERLDHLAYYDTLTGLPNRALFLQQAAQIINAARRQKSAAVVVLLDPERFRSINILLGRDGGDEFLRQVAARLRSASRGDDSVARIGPDVFAVAVSGVAKPADVAHYVNNRLLPGLEHPFRIDGREIRVSARVGIAVFPEDGANADALIDGAEAALRTAKKDLARFAFHAPAVNARVSESLLLESKLRSAVQNGEFVLHYQPKVDLASNRVVGLEALIRWRDPGGGLVPPGSFIPMLEETGLIVEVGKWALHQAVSDALDWRAHGIRLPRIAVNVSPIQVRQSEFLATVLDAIGRFPPGEVSLDLEITESAIMEQLEQVAAKLQTLRGAGMSISLDDFGTGYSSLAHLGRLPIDVLKIDRSFVMHMESNEYSRNLVTMVCALARAARLKVVAEGVETEPQACALRLLGCDQMQGFLFSKPRPIEELEPILLRNGYSDGNQRMPCALAG